MSAAELTTLITSVTAAVTAVSGLVVAIYHILHHDAPPTDGPSGIDAGSPPTQR